MIEWVFYFKQLQINGVKQSQVINKYFKGVLIIVQTYIKFKEKSTVKVVNNTNYLNICDK
jgi:hypothetical protein